jgi:hypothetical protein
MTGTTAHTYRLACFAGCLFLPLGMTGGTLDLPCHEVKLTTRPGWTIAGSWSEDGSTLEVVDNLHNEVLNYSVQGQFLGSLPAEQEAVGDFLLQESRRPGESLLGIFQWQQAGSDFVVFADVLRDGTTTPAGWSSGFFRLPAGRASAFRSLYEISPEDPMRLFYRLGSPLIAALGDTSYVLLMEERPRIVRNRPGSGEWELLRAFPAEFDQRPALPAWVDLAEYARVMKTVESVSMPVALFGWEEHLWVVGRRPEEGRTRWTLTKIDPRCDAVLWTTVIHLPPSVHHVTVVPGPRYWAWLEKGTVRGLYDQEVERILFLPSALLRNVAGRSLCE